MGALWKAALGCELVARIALRAILPPRDEVARFLAAYGDVPTPQVGPTPPPPQHPPPSLPRRPISGCIGCGACDALAEGALASALRGGIERFNLDPVAPVCPVGLKMPPLS